MTKARTPFRVYLFYRKQQRKNKMKLAFVIGLAMTIIGVNSDSEAVKTLVGCLGLVTMFFSPLFSKD